MKKFTVKSVERLTFETEDIKPTNDEKPLVYTNELLEEIKCEFYRKKILDKLLIEVMTGIEKGVMEKEMPPIKVKIKL